MKKIFVIEGIDSSGKETQTKELIRRLKENNINTYSISFPNYNELSSGPVREYLNGSISQNTNDISAKATSYLFAIDRYITFNKHIKSLYNDNNTVIIFDRYTQSNLIHQGGKIISKYGHNCKDKLDEFSDWLYNLEYVDLELPKPTLTFYLHVPLEVSIKMMEHRNNKITNDEKKDINESNLDFLKNSTASGLYYAKSQNWNIIECTKDNNIRSIEDISDEIFKLVLKYIDS